MSRRTTGLVYLLILLAVLIIGTVIVFRTQSERIAIKVGDLVTARFGKARNLSIEVGDLRGSLLGDVRLQDVCVTYTGEEVPRILLSAQAVYAKLNLASLIVGRVKFDSIGVVSPKLVIPRRPDGTRIYLSGDADALPKGEPSGFEIAKFAISDGSVRWDGHKPGLVTRADLVGSYLQDREGSIIKLDRGSLTYGKGLIFDNLTGAVHASEDAIRITEMVVGTPNSSIRVYGFFGRGKNDSLELEARVDSLNLNEAFMLYGGAERPGLGTLKGRLKADGRYSRVAIESDLDCVIREWVCEDLIARVVYEDKTVRVDHLTSLLNGTPVSLAGKYTLSTPPLYEGIIAFTGLDISRFVGDETGTYSSDLDGSVRFDGRGLDAQQFALVTYPRLDRGRYRDWRFDSVRGRVVIDAESVSLESVVATVGEARLDARGRIGFDGETGLALALDCGRLEDVYSYHRVAGLGGAVASSGSLTVRRGVLGFSVSSVARLLRYQGTRVESLVVDLALHQRAGSLTGQTTVFAKDVDIHGFRASEFIGDVLIEGKRLAIDRAVFTRTDGSLLGFAGDVEIAEGGFDVGIGNLFVELGGFIWENVDTVFASYRQDSLSVGDVELSSDMGRVSILNSSYVKGHYSLESRIDDFDLGLLKEVLKRELPTGLLNLGLKAHGSADSLSFDMDFNVEQGDLRSVRFDDLTGEVRYDGEALWLDRVSLTQNGGEVRIHGMIPMDLAPARVGSLAKAGKAYDIVGDMGRIVIAVEDIDISLLEPLVPPVSKFGGLASLTMEISGNKANPRIVTEGRLKDAVYGEVSVGAVAWDLVVEDSLLSVAEFTFGRDPEEGAISGGLPIALSLLPFSSQLLKRPIDLSVQVENGNLGVLEEIFPRLRVYSGTYGVDLRIAGDAEDPTFRGHVTLSGGRLRFEGVAQDLRDISLEVVGDGKRFDIVRMTAEDKALRTAGYFTLEGIKVTDWRFDVELKDFAITEFENLYVRLDGKLTITAEEFEPGKPVPRVEGSITVKEGEYFYSHAGAEGGGAIVGPSASPSWVMNVAIEVPNAFWIRGGDIEAELQGDLSVKRGREGLLVLGTLRTLRGRFYVYHNVFRITRGEFRFADVTSLRNVYIDLEADSRVLDEKIELAARGYIDRLDISATSESDWSETQIFAALTVRRGEASGEEPTSKFFSDEFLRSWAVALVNRFGDGVAREVNLDRIGVEVGDLGDGDALGATRVTFGKYVSDKLYLEYTQSLGSLYGDRTKFTQRGLSFPERQLSVEYRLSDRFSMEGETGTLGGLGYFDVDLKFKFGY